MEKSDFSKEFNTRLASKYGIEFDSKTVKSVIDNFIGTLSSLLEEGKEINFYGFGKFSVRNRKGKKAFDMWKKIPVTLAATKVPFLKFSKKFKSLIK